MGRRGTDVHGRNEGEKQGVMVQGRKQFREEVGELRAEVGLTQVLEAGKEGPQTLIGSSEA